MIVLNDKIKKPRKNRPDKFDTFYKCYCDSCGKDRGYLDKVRANKLCKSCTGKISHSNVSSHTRKKMSKAKIGKTPWNKGYSTPLKTRLKQSKARKGKTPWNKNLKGKAKECLKSRYRHYLRKAVFKQIISNDFKEYLGCNAEELRAHIESQFTKNMTWENYGPSGWHLDHIVPLKYFDLTDDNELRIACNYKNVQPLFHKKNLSKHKRIVYLLTGAPGSGKSWVCDKLSNLLDPIDLDKVKKSELLNVIKSRYCPVIAMTIGVSTFIKNNPDLDIKLVVIREPKKIIKERLIERGGQWTKTIDARIKRMESLANKAVFTGTSSEVLIFLKTASF